MNIIEVKNVSKNYKTYQRGSEFKDTFYSIFMRRKITVNAIKDLSFNIPQGQIVGIIGPNGAGKSTLIKMLTGVLVPTSGEIHSMGFIPCKQRSKYTFNIGVVFGQKSQLIWDIPPQDAFYMNKAIYNIDTKQFNSNLNEFIELLDVSEVIKKPTRKLSLGERMKCEFIMAMLHNPEIVFLDEPTIGLDIIAQSKIHEVIQKLNKKGVTFILTTHNLEDIEKLAQRVMVINQGELVFDNNIESLRNHLGTKKRIRIISNNKLAILEQEGVKIINTDKDYENLIELDSNIINTMKFISEFVGNENISDISIEEPPIDEVIRVLYSKQKER